MESYSQEISIKRSKSSLVSILADPYRFAGITGHLVFYKVFDKEKGNFVPEGDAIAPINKFRAVFVFEDNKGKLNSIRGTMIGPEISPNSISYKGESDDGKMSLEVSFYLTQKDEVTKVRVLAITEFKHSILQKLFGSSLGNVSEHVVDKHLVPHLRSINPEVDFTLNQVKRVTGSTTEIIENIKSIPDIKFGLMIIKGDNFKFKAIISDNKIENARLELEGHKYYGEEALSRMLTLGGKGEMTIYEIPVEEFLNKEFERG
ncbi:MAG: hypothetical protein K1T65_04235 [Candidatus Aramenus sp.]|nr:hypothetical protein [Candidatus Aramenus sp.]